MPRDATRWTPRRERIGFALILLVALLAHAPVLGWGFYADDFSHQLALMGELDGIPLKPWSLYDFGVAPRPGSPAFEIGAFPWWTDADWTLRFLRPLASLSIALDHAIFGGEALGYHAVGLAIFALLLFVLRGLYHDAGLDPRATELALAIVAFGGASLFTVGWIANRNSLLEALFAALALRAAASRARASALAAFAFALLALASKESGIAVLLAIGLVRWPRERRSASIALGLAVMYLAGYFAAGYGSRSLFYPLPWQDPAEWARRAASMATLGPSSMIVPLPPDVATIAPGALWPLVAVAAALVVPASIAIARMPRSARPPAAWLAFAALSIGAQLGAPASERLLFVAEIGLAPWLAAWIVRSTTSSSSASRVVARACAILATFVAPAMVALRAEQARELFERSRGVLREAPIERGDRAIVLQWPTAISALAPMAQWVFDAREQDTRIAALQLGRRALRWTRAGVREHDFESADDAPLAAALFERVFRSRSGARPAVGTRWPASFFDVEALAVDGGGVRKVRVRLHDDVEPSRSRFLAWREGRMVVLDPPAIGATIDVEEAEPLSPMMP